MVISLGTLAPVIPTHIAQKYFRDVVLGLEFRKNCINSSAFQQYHSL